MGETAVDLIDFFDITNCSGHGGMDERLARNCQGGAPKLKFKGMNESNQSNE
jgi:hypothetical protein